MADFDWKKFDVSHWWKVLSAAGIAMLMAAIAAKISPGDLSRSRHSLPWRR